MPAGTVSRRYIPGLAVTVAAGIAGFFVARNSSVAQPKKAAAAANSQGGSAAGGERLARVDDVPPGGGVVLKDQDVVLTRDQAGTVAAFSATCTHQGCQVTSVENGTINCPCHGSKFDARTGDPVDGPADRPLPKANVVVRGGDIFANGA
jgi:Rieske Fe-S protein